MAKNAIAKKHWKLLRAINAYTRKEIGAENSL